MPGDEMSGDAKILRKLFFGSGTIVIILMSLITVAFISFRAMSQANAWRERSYKTLVGTQSLREGLVNMDIAARGFVITGEMEFLPALFKGQKDFLQHMKEVKQLTADNPTQQERLSQLERTYE